MGSMEMILWIEICYQILFALFDFYQLETRRRIENIFITSYNNFDIKTTPFSLPFEKKFPILKFVIHSFHRFIYIEKNKQIIQTWVSLWRIERSCLFQVNRQWEGHKNTCDPTLRWICGPFILYQYRWFISSLSNFEWVDVDFLTVF